MSYHFFIDKRLIKNRLQKESVALVAPSHSSAQIQMTVHCFHHMISIKSDK